MRQNYFVGETTESELALWKSPLNLQDHHVRRLFAKEFVTELRRVGNATRGDMRDANVSLLKVPAEIDELEQLVEVSRRMGWVERRERSWQGGTEQEWTLTDTGLAEAPPASLDLKQVFTRVLHSVDPSRTRGASDWVPLVALLAGIAAATQQSGNQQTVIAIRVLSIATLSLALVRGMIGEWYLVRAAKAFPRIQECEFYRGIKVFQSWRHLRLVAIFDIAVLAAFGLGVFLVWLWCLVSLGVAAVVGSVIWVRLRGPWIELRRKRPPEASAG
jgi:hypothetical protein